MIKFQRFTSFNLKIILTSFTFILLLTGNGAGNDGINQNRLASNGAEIIDANFNPAIGFQGRIFTTAKQPDGKIIIGGFFSFVNNLVYPNLARLSEDGSLDLSFKPPVMDEGVSEIALQSDGKILIAGFFTQLNGIKRHRIARLNQDGSLDTSFDAQNSTSSTIRTIAVQSNGRILVGGDFWSFNGVNRKGLICLKPDGSVEQSFTTETGGFNTVIVHLAVLPDEKILVSGNFDLIGGIARANVAMLESDGKVIQSFNANTSGGTINESIPLPGGKILIAGRVSVGSNLTHIARLNANGTVDDTFTEDAQIRTWVAGISLHPDGRIFVFGLGAFFDSPNGGSRQVLLLNPNGSIDSSFEVRTVKHEASFVDAFVQTDGKINLIGEFSRINSAARFSLARLHPDGTVDQDYAAFTVGRSFSSGAPVSTIAFQPDGKIIVGGNFVQVGGKARQSLARLNDDGSLDESFNQSNVLFREGASIYLNAVALQPDGKILIAGEFDSVSGVQRRKMARLNPNGSLDESFDIGFNADLPISTIVLQSDGKIFVGGLFSYIGGIERKNVARLNSNGSIDTSFNANSTIDTGSGRKIIIQPDNKILVSGVWQHSNFTWRSLVRLNPDGTRDQSFNVYLNDQGPDMELQPDGKIFIGGGFTEVNGTPKQGVALLNSDGSLTSAFSNGGTNSNIYAVAREANGKYIVGGQFSQVQYRFRPGLARFNPAGIIDDSFFNNGTSNGIIRRIFIQPDGKVIVCGDFTLINNVARLGIVRLIIRQFTPFDFDGDGKTDISVFRPSNSAWYLLQSQSGFKGVQFGIPTDKLTPADFDGDGRADIAVFRDGNWYFIKSSNGQFSSVRFGTSGDLPRPADFDGDGRADIAVFRPSNGTWYWLESSSGQFNGAQFGAGGDVPVIADFDGDGKSDLTVFRPSTGSWYWLNSSNGQFNAVQFGVNEDIPAVGDFDGDGKTDISVFRPSAGGWYRLNSSNGQFVGVQFGASGDSPVVGDYDGDGKSDIAVFRSSDGNWYLLNSQNGFTAAQFGIGEDKPIPTSFQ